MTFTLFGRIIEFRIYRPDEKFRNLTVAEAEEIWKLYGNYVKYHPKNLECNRSSREEGQAIVSSKDRDLTNHIASILKSARSYGGDVRGKPE